MKRFAARALFVSLIRVDPSQPAKHSSCLPYEMPAFMRFARNRALDTDGPFVYR
jgi:hypothetical protein